MKKTLSLFLIGYMLFGFTINVFAQYGGIPPTTRFPQQPTGVSGAPAPYLPPHPYPEPIDPSFPKPGDVVKYYTGGWVLDELLDTTTYFRSDEFRTNMYEIRQQAENALQTGNPEQYFTEIQQRLLVAINEMIDKLTNKKNQIINEASLNDNIATRLEDLDTPGGNPSKDNEIKQLVAAFFDNLIAQMNVYKMQAANSTTVNQLRDIADQADAYVHNPALQEQGRTLAARVMGQRILFFSYNVQLVVNFVFCIIPEFEKAGFDITKHIRYITSPDSLFYTDWYSLSPINPDTTGTYPYRSPENAQISRFPNGSFGGREEYRIAASILENPQCKGTEACKQEVRPHMKKGKLILQDMFHLLYWAYDNFLVQIENCQAQYGNACQLKLINVNINACPFPDIRWHQQSGTAPTGMFPTDAFGGLLSRTPTPQGGGSGGSGGSGGGSGRPSTTRAPRR